MSANVDFIPDLPSGPLDSYRNMAKFSWKKMKTVLENPVKIKLKMKLWQTLEKDPLFQHSKGLSTDELKRLAAVRVKKFLKYNFIKCTENMSYVDKTLHLMTVNEALIVTFPDLSIKIGLGTSLFTNAILNLGTDRHKDIHQAAWDGQIFAGFALTEIAHGSNTKDMQTTATYDPATQEFVIHTPCFEASKCYVGNLGKTCTMVLLLAQLYTEGECKGLHVFLVPVRDPRTLQPYPGIIIGDIGEKGGLNGIDNGFVSFTNYRIPREYLLNRTGDVSPSGLYETKFTDPARILGAALEMLSAARVAIVQENTCILGSAVTIAIRYAAIRKQFGNGDGEVALIEYPLHQWRLFPYVAASYVFKLFTKVLTNIYVGTVESSNRGDHIENLSDIVSEIHAMVSTAKPLISWTCRDALQQCREACGGFGYLRAARITDMRADQDPSVTYEGDNNVLQQQTSKWLLRQWENRDGEIASPLGTCLFLKGAKRGYGEQEVDNKEFITECYQWLVCWLCSVTHELLEEYSKAGACNFTARNYAKVYRTSVLTKAYCENLTLQFYYRDIEQYKNDLEMYTVLDQLGRLYGLWSLDKHLVYLYEGGFCTGPGLARKIKEAVLRLCNDLKPSMLGVIDALAPPDYVLNSVIGKADGELYKNIQSEFFQNEANLSRATWWKEVIEPNAPDIRRLVSKL